MTQITIEQAIPIALGHHQAGRLAEAERIDRQVLAQVPDQANVLHLLGVRASQAAQADVAIELIGRAIAIDPAVAEYHANLGNALWSRGRLDEAIAACHRAIELRPDLAEAQNNLGNALKEQ